MRVEAEGAKAIVVGHEDHALAGELFTVVLRERSRSTGEGPAVRPDDDRQLVGRGVRRRPDVEIQTVFADRLWWRATLPASSPARLHAACAELIGPANAFPLCGRLRSAPAERTDRRRRERDALEHTNGIARSRHPRHE